MELFDLLNELEELAETSTRIPMTRRILVDEDKILDLLDRIRTVLPEEMRQAKWIIQEREKVLTDTRKEAQRMVESAEREIEKRADENEISRRAREMAEEIVHKADTVAREIKKGAHVYADDILASMENMLNSVLSEIHEGRSQLSSAKAAEEK